MVLWDINRIALGTKLFLMYGSLRLPCGLYQTISIWYVHTEGTALLFESEWVLKPYGSPPASKTHPPL